jgi:hypothetical protein
VIDEGFWAGYDLLIRRFRRIEWDRRESKDRRREDRAGFFAEALEAIAMGARRSCPRFADVFIFAASDFPPFLYISFHHSFSLYIRYIFTIYICWSGWDGEE